MSEDSQRIGSVRAGAAQPIAGTASTRTGAADRTLRSCEPPHRWPPPRSPASIVLVEVADPGGGEPPAYIAPLHIHHAEDEAWYVLEGTLGFRLGDGQIEAPAGAAVLVPRGVAHTFWNAAPEPARYLLVMGPTTHPARSRRCTGHSRGTWTRSSRAHESTLLGWP